jgi:pimeloyl-ACP methyl ester carboxylesterase
VRSIIDWFFYDGKNIPVFCYGLQNNTDTRATFVIVGWGSAYCGQYEKLCIKIRSITGRNVHIFGYSAHLTELPGGTFHTAQLNAKCAFVIAVMRSIITHFGYKRVDIVGYSEGALYAIPATIALGDVMESLSLVCPAGITGKESLFAIFGSACRNRVHQLRLLRGENREGAERLRDHLGAIRRYVQDFLFIPSEIKTPFKRVTAWFTLRWKLLIDMVSPGRVDLRNTLELIRMRKISVAILACPSDAMIPYEKLAERYDGKDGFRFIPFDGDHQAIFNDPSSIAFKLFREQ